MGQGEDGDELLWVLFLLFHDVVDKLFLNVVDNRCKLPKKFDELWVLHISISTCWSCPFAGMIYMAFSG